MIHVAENQSSVVYDQIRLKRGCTAAKDCQRLEFRINEEEGLYYPYSENKGVDQLHGNREADLRPCFRVCKKPVLS